MLETFLFLVAAVQLAVAASLVASGLVARAVGLRVERVALGFGPALGGFSLGGTRWQLGAFILGGCVQIAGRDATRAPVADDDPGAFHNRPLLLRLLPSLTAPLAFLVVAGVSAAFFYAVVGVPVNNGRARIADLNEGSPAAAGGLRRGDEILEVDGQPVTRDNLSDVVTAARGERVLVTVRRHGVVERHQVTPARDLDRRRLGITIADASGYERGPLLASVGRGLAFPVRYLVWVVGQLRDVRGHATLSGPIGAVRTIASIDDGYERMFSIAVVLVYAALWLALIPVPPFPLGRALLVLTGWRGRRRRAGVEARTLGAIARPRGRRPRLLVTALAVTLVGALVIGDRLDPGPLRELILGAGGVALLLTPLVATGWPRAWIVCVYWLLYEVAAQLLVCALTPALGPAYLAVFAIDAILLVWLTRPSPRRWFGQECPACGGLGARPVWSQGGAFGCVRCGSAWVAE